MIISLIAAMAQNRVIGNRNVIPWDLPSDRQRFRQLTMGHALIFGRITFESIGRPLSGRKNIVLSRNSRYQAAGATVAHNLQEAFQLCRDDSEVFVCGGGIVYEETIVLADRIYLAVIQRVYDGDAFFPVLPPFFSEVSREDFLDRIPYSFIRYERRV
jgi:dihydrofolate reductase